MSPTTFGIDQCLIKSICEWIGAGFAFGAAGFWFYASWIARKSMLQSIMAEYDRTLVLQARYNAIAALCAGLAALLQIAILNLPVCRAFG